MNPKNTVATQTPQELLEHLQALVTEAEKILATSQPEHSETRLEALRERYEAAQERLADFYQNAKKKVVVGAKRTDEAIRTHPYQSIAIAAGVALLAGFLWGRRTTK
jgi:ElaB/YqjD/DUF883 family membrane-anchored ribosome-binding protein